MLIEQWSMRFPEELTEAAVRNQFRPAEKYRISRYSYPAGAHFSGGMLPGTCFVLSGRCSIAFGIDRAEIATKDIVHVPGGSYNLCVDGPSPVELVLVWQIPAVPEAQKDTVARAIEVEQTIATKGTPVRP